MALQAGKPDDLAAAEPRGRSAAIAGARRTPVAPQQWSSAQASSCVHPELRVGDHQLQQPLAGDLRCLQGLDHPAAAQHGDAVRQPPDLVQAMRDEQRQAAVGDEGAQGLEQDIAVGEVEGRGHLVEDQDTWIAHQRAGEHDELLLGQRQLAGRRVEIGQRAGEPRQGPLRHFAAARRRGRARRNSPS